MNKKMYIRFATIRRSAYDYLFFDKNNQLIAIMDKSLFKHSKYSEHREKEIFFGFSTIINAELYEFQE